MFFFHFPSALPVDPSKRLEEGRIVKFDYLSSDCARKRETLGLFGIYLLFSVESKTALMTILATFGSICSKNSL